MRSAVISAIAIAVTYFNAIEKKSHSGDEFPSINWPMSAQDRQVCHEQFVASGGPHPDIGLKIDQLLIKYGYPVECINVTTEDGYILGVYRIPYSPKSPLVDGHLKPAVLLFHGLLANGFGWLIQHGPKNLAMLLADSGYDVFIVNFRGTSYSQGHVDPNTTPDKSKYWDFSFHEMGVYDIPAVIESVTKLTTHQTMYFVGHSMGSSAFTIMLSERPEYNERILTAFLLAPAIHLGNTYNSLRLIFRFRNLFQYKANRFLGGKFQGDKIIERLIRDNPGQLCASEENTCGSCANLFFLMFGYDAPQTNYTTFSLGQAAFPDRISTKTAAHFFQFLDTDEFCQFNYGFKLLNLYKYGRFRPPCYKFKNIRTPSIIYWGPNDVIVKPKNIFKSAARFPRAALKELRKVEWPLFGHFDFAFAKHADVLLYNHILDIMKNETYL